MNDLSPFQSFLVDYETEISDESFVQDVFLADVKNLNNVDDVISYYRNLRNWYTDSQVSLLLDLVYLLGVNFPGIKSYRELDVTDNPYFQMTYRVDASFPSKDRETWIIATIPLGLIDLKKEVIFKFEAGDLEGVIGGIYNYLTDSGNFFHLITPREARFILYQLYGYEVQLY